jgi:ABC-type branched-subunit amino acid transport system substrate-binding protein
MMAGFPGNGRAFPSVARAALPLAGCLLAAASLSWIRPGRSDPSFDASSSPPAVVPAARPPHAAGQGPSKASADSISGARERGKRIYATGISPSGGKMTAVLGESTSEIPAAALRCINCHLGDGRGKPEGGVSPSDIRWESLTKPYGATDARGRRRPPYDDRSLRRAITMGVDPAGKPLDAAMPRYRVTHADLADLVAYLVVLGRELEPGVSEDRIRIGVILPPSPLFPEMGPALRAALSAFASEINRAGGIYRREIELTFAESPARREDRPEAAIAFVRREGVFSLAASFIAGAEAEIARRLDEEGVPLIGAQTLYPPAESAPNRGVFYLTSGLPGQGGALVRFAHEAHAAGGRNAALLHPPSGQPGDDGPSRGGLHDTASSIASACDGLGWPLQLCPTPLQGDDAGTWARRLAGTDTDVVFSLLTAEQNIRFLQAAAARRWYPICCIPGNLVGRELFEAPDGFDRRIFLSFGNLPQKLPFGIRSYDALAATFQLPSVQLAAQFEALAAMKALVQAAQASGASLSRERLVEQLEAFREYRTGFAPPLTFGPDRRAGADGAYVVTVDLADRKLVPVTDWVEAPAKPHSNP